MYSENPPAKQTNKTHHQQNNTQTYTFFLILPNSWDSSYVNIPVLQRAGRREWGKGTEQAFPKALPVKSKQMPLHCLIPFALLNSPKLLSDFSYTNQNVKSQKGYKVIG